MKLKLGLPVNGIGAYKATSHLQSHTAAYFMFKFNKFQYCCLQSLQIPVMRPAKWRYSVKEG